MHVPIANIPKADLSLRPELVPVCKAAGIETEDIITLDDLPELSTIESYLSPDLTRWILVDHNALQGQLGRIYSDRVVGVVDHHADEGKVPPTTEKEPRVIETCGSCTSLVAEYVSNGLTNLMMRSSRCVRVTDDPDELSDDEDDEKSFAVRYDAQVAQLALAPILIDTNNLQDKTKTTEHDHKAVEYLETRINDCPPSSKDYDRAAYFERIQRAKQSLDSLSVRDILRKDYKQWDENGMTLGMSSVVKPIEYLGNKAKQEQHSSATGSESLLEAVKAFAEERSLTVAAVMTTFTAADSNFNRELMVVCHDDDGKTCVDRFIQQCKEELQLDDMDGGEQRSVQYHIWQQGKLSASRKQVAPMLRNAMTSS